MNRIYRLIWNRSLGLWIAASEHARGRSKGSRGKSGVSGAVAVSGALTAALIGALGAGLAHAGPQGGQVTAGAGSIARSGATTVTQSSQSLSVNWQSFNVGSQETVDFVQPAATAVAINRILGSSASQIYGHLDANGLVYLINPNGVVFGPGAQVDVGGLVASTLDLTGGAGTNSQSFSGAGPGSVINRGTITAAAGGTVALLGNHVVNQGSISAQLGTVALGAGSALTLSFAGNKLVSLRVDQSTLNTLAANGGLIRADGGRVILSAGARDALLASAVNNTGIIEARTVQNQAGTISLVGGMSNGTVRVGGTLDAGAPTGGHGGAIETSAAHVQVANTAKITTAAVAGLSGTWLIDPTDFTIAASGGDITGATLSANLGGGNVTILSSSGTHGGTAGDINVNDTVSWAANTLTLNAQNNINVNSTMNGSGSARLALLYGQGALSAGNLSNYNVNAPVNLPAGPNFSTKLGSDGTTVNYTVITSLGAAGDAVTAPGTATLQGMAAAGNLAGNFALGANIDATPTAAWNGGLGWTPVGSTAAQYTGNFDGLGHTITNLVVSQPTAPEVGLFGTALGSIQNVGLVGGSVTGAEYAGMLVARAFGAINNSYATGSVTGLVNNGSPKSGGLAGESSGSITNSYATGAVTGRGRVGGLVGSNFGLIDSSYASGNVLGTNIWNGGLAGENQGTINHSHASGSVSGGTYNGGLVGESQGLIENSYATGSVSTAGSYGGGLVGYVNNAANTSATVTNCYATGSVNAAGYAGGLVGENSWGTISNSHASGSVTGGTRVGGLVGFNVSGPTPATISASYSTGTVAGTSEVGGLVGLNNGILRNAFYNVDVVVINSGHQLTSGGLYNAQYLDWFNHGETLNIANYAGTLPTGAGGYYDVGSVQGLRDMLGFSESDAALNFRLSANISLPAQFFIPYFAGSFDGAGKTIAGLSLNLPDSHLGLFGYLPASGTTIANVGVLNGSVTGVNQIGGLVGFMPASNSIATSYFSGNVSGNSYVGGLVGKMNYGASPAVSKSYSSGTVSGSSNVGGLVGANYGTIDKSYSTSRVSGSSYVGGLVGSNSGTVTNSFYNTSLNGGLTGFGTSGGVADVAGVVWGLSTAQMQTQANFTSATTANGNVSPGWDFGATLFLYEGNTTPLLRAFMTPITIGGGTITQAYNKIPFAGTSADLVYSITPDMSHILGTVSFTGDAIGAVNPGSYTLVPGGLYSDQQGYIITFAGGSLTIGAAVVPVAPPPPRNPAVTTPYALAGVTTQLQSYLYGPMPGTQPGALTAEPTLAVVQSGATAVGSEEGASGSAGGGDSVITLTGGKAIAVNVTMKIGAFGTLQIQNGGMLLPGDVVQASP